VSRARGLRRAAAALGLAVAAGACGAPPPPNLVLITLDTTRPDRLGPYAAGAADTPALDAFARESVVYEHAYSTSSWTLPSHASLFTGLLPMQHGAQAVAGGPSALLGYGVRGLGDGFTTLAETLAAHGYRTGAVVGGPALRRELGVAQGFEVYHDELDGPLDKLIGKRGAEVANRAIALVQDFGSQPFFLFANFYDPHAPYDPPPPRSRGVPDAETKRVVAAVMRHFAAGAAADDGARLDPQQDADLARLLQGYDAEIAYMDAQLGRLLAALRATPRWSDTLVAITADHGESFGEHFYVSHGAHLYEDNVHVPLMVRFPGGAGAGTRVPEPVSNRALFGTLLETAGLPLPAGTPSLDAAGEPIVTEVRRSDANVRLFGSHFDRDLRAIYAPPFKLIEDTTGRVELFDLENDPGELHNLAEAQPERVEALKRQLAEIRRQHPPRFDSAARAKLSDDTEEALRALGYLP
jgi:choline-sulfatase